MTGRRNSAGTAPPAGSRSGDRSPDPVAALVREAMRILPDPDTDARLPHEEHEQEGETLVAVRAAADAEALARMTAAANALRAAREPDETLRREGKWSAHMGRWWLVRPKGTDPSSEALYLHAVLQDDRGRHHDHPWRSAGLVLSGRVTDEDRRGNRVTLEPGDAALRSAAHAHRLIVNGSEALTVFRTGKRRHQWGFFDERGTWSRAAKDVTDLPR